MLAKLLARKAQACLELSRIEVDPVQRTAAAALALADARSRGLWAPKSAMAAKFKQLAGLLPKPLPPTPPLPAGCPGRMPLAMAITEMLRQLSLTQARGRPAPPPVPRAPPLTAGGALPQLSSDDLVKFYGGATRPPRPAVAAQG